MYARDILGEGVVELFRRKLLFLLLRCMDDLFGAELTDLADARHAMLLELAALLGRTLPEDKTFVPSAQMPVLGVAATLESQAVSVLFLEV